MFTYMDFTIRWDIKGHDFHSQLQDIYLLKNKQGKPISYKTAVKLWDKMFQLSN
jgi:hypothetical protein